MNRRMRDLIVLLAAAFVFGPTLLLAAGDSFDRMKAIALPYVLPVLGILLVLLVVRAFVRD